MFYIQQDEKIVLFDEDKQKLQNTITFTMPQYQGLEIKEVEEGYVIYNLELMTIEEMEAKQAQKERERLNLLSMTKREMFLGLYQAKQITPDMLKAQITDPQALIEFEYANDYYRGNQLIDVIGGQLGFTSEQLDKFFETKDYHYLTTCKLTINPTPAEATVVIDSEVVNEVTVPYGSVVYYVVSCDGYESKANVFEITKDEFLEVVLDGDTTDTEQSTDVLNDMDKVNNKLTVDFKQSEI